MRMTRWSSQMGRWTLAIGVGVLFLTVGLVLRQWQSSTIVPVANLMPSRDETVAASAVRPPPTPTEGFVGIAVCAKCHAAIAESYRSHPMYRSAGRVPGENEVEKLGRNRKTSFEPPGNRRYRVQRSETEVVHHEYMVDTDGEVIDDLAVPVYLFIGSGARGKTYAVNRDGLLFESLISWYSTHGGQWGLSPGYEPESHRNFERRIRSACIMCHAGRVANVPSEDDVFEEPLFLEAAIGCERCHGPGEKHVARQESGEVIVGPSDSGGGLRDDSIVNPERLDPARRESICNQCHLPGEHIVLRYGRTFYDFRPGQRLDEVWTVSVEGSGMRDDGTTKSVSQVQQMRASACYRRSEGRMSCSSCHSPHSVPDSATKADYYRGRCMDCHAEKGCSIAEAERAEPPARDSCIHCHMPRLAAHDIPHTTQTDHRIGRTPEDQQWGDATRSLISEWKLFDGAEERLTPWEIDRVRGLDRVEMAAKKGPTAVTHFRAAEPLLRSSLRAAADDVPVLEALGRALMGQQRGGEARKHFERLLEIQPRHEDALDLLAEICHGSGEFATGIKYGERLLEVNPWIARYFARQADMLRRSGRLKEAIECGEEALCLDPWQTQIRRWLVEAYRIVGDGAASERHTGFVRRMHGS